MKRNLISLLIVVLLVGCGKDEDAVYDTAANPDGFPAVAIDIITGIENKNLLGGEAIMNAFGELYTQHSELLDNEKWKGVIDRLGVYFQRTADSLVELGAGSFSLAAEYYQLGSFARPEDIPLRTTASLFGCWLTADESVRPQLDALGNSDYGLDAILPVTRYFIMGDSVQQQFFQSHLRDEFKKRIESANLIAEEKVSGLGSADRAILVYAELADASILNKLTTFSPPAIDLVGARVSPLDSIEYRLELYFMPRVIIGEKLQVHLGVQSSQLGAATVNVAPKTPTTEWQQNRVVAISRKLHCPGRLEAVGVGLCDFAAPEPRFLLPQGEDSGLYFLRSPEMDFE
jgi:hypothetical protein